MTIQRRFAPIGGRFEPEQVAGFTGIYIQEEKYSSLLESWCQHLVFFGSDKEEQFLKNAINNIVLDILQAKGKVDKKIAKGVFEEVALSEARSTQRLKLTSRSNIERIIETCMAPAKKA